jgi:nucleotide-binding universal stress UspA family protein
MKKILVPTDFSENSKHALRIAARLAAKLGATLEIMHANTALAYAPPLPEYAGTVQYNLDDYYEQATTELFNLKTELIAELGNERLQIETRIEEGFLHSTINRVSDEDKIDLIVMGTKGATGAVEFLVGSNTEKVIRTCICPILALPATAGDRFEPVTVVLASTLQLDQLPAFKVLASWQKIFPIDVQVLYLNNPAGFDNNGEIDQAVANFAEKAGLNNVTSNVSNNTFNEEASILHFAKDIKADLIVMATHQRQGLSHLVFGSLTEDTVNHSDIPVLAVPLR